MASNRQGIAPAQAKRLREARLPLHPIFCSCFLKAPLAIDRGAELMVSRLRAAVCQQGLDD